MLHILGAFGKQQHLETLKLTLIGMCSHHNRLKEMLQFTCITTYFHSNAYDFYPSVESAVLTTHQLRLMSKAAKHNKIYLILSLSKKKKKNIYIYIYIYVYI